MYPLSTGTALSRCGVAAIDGMVLAMACDIDAQAAFCAVSFGELDAWELFGGCSVVCQQTPGPVVLQHAGKSPHGLGREQPAIRLPCDP